MVLVLLTLPLVALPVVVLPETVTLPLWPAWKLELPTKRLLTVTVFWTLTLPHSTRFTDLSPVVSIEPSGQVLVPVEQSPVTGAGAVAVTVVVLFWVTPPEAELPLEVVLPLTVTLPLLPSWTLLLNTVRLFLLTFLQTFTLPVATTFTEFFPVVLIVDAIATLPNRLKLKTVAEPN